MATITGTNLLNQFLADRGITTLSTVQKQALAARLDQMMAANTFSDTQIAVVLGSNPTILASVPAGQTPLTVLGSTVSQAKTEVTNDTPPNPNPVITYTLAASATEINEAAANTFTVTASAPVTVATEVTFQLALGTAQLNDFGAGSFNAAKVVIPAGQTTATYAYTAIGNDGTELSETYSVTATVAGVAVGTQNVTILDGNAGAGETFKLTANQDNVTGTSGNDTIDATNTTLQASDAINGGAGTDTFNYTDAGTTGGNVPAALVSNVEIINVRNVNGSAAVAATKEQVTLTFNDITGGANTGASVALAGDTTVTKTTAVSATETGAALASYFASNLPGGYEFVSLNGNQLVIRAAAAGTKTDLTSTFTAGTGAGAAGSNATVAIVQGTAEVASTGVTDTVAASNFAGATDFNSVNSLNKVVFTGLSGTQAVGIKGNGTVLNGDVDYTLAATATATTINVADGTKQGTVTNTGANVATATINSTGAANTLTGIDLGTGTNVTSLTVNAASNLKTAINNDFAATAALTVAGAASSVELTGGSTATLKTIDASGLTAGGLTIALSTTNTSFKGGQGNDVVTTAAIGATASVDAGAGTADILVANADTDVDSAAEAALYKGFEVLRTAADSSKTYDMSLFTASTIGAVQVSTATSQTISKMTAAQAGAVTVRGDQTTNLTLALADATGTADVVGLTLSNPTATATAPADVDVAGLIISGVETLNITSSGGGVDLTNAGTLNSLTFGTAATDINKLANITVAGASSLEITLDDTGRAITLTSSQTGTAALKVAGDLLKGSSVTTTANKDDITVTAQAAGGASDFITYNAGAGDDAISAAVTAINNTDSTKASVKIEGGAGVDTLTISGGGATMVDANFQFLTGIEKLTVGADGAVDLKTGGFFDTNFKAAGIELTADVSATNGDTISVDMATFTGNVKATLTNATDSATTITTGAGVDTIKVTNAGTATTDTITVAAGAGADTININSKATGAAANVIVVTGGQGADTINLAETARGTATTQNQAKLNVAAGDSTVAAADVVTGFRLADGTNYSDNLNLDSFQIAGAQTAAAVTGYTGAELTYSISAAGKMTFAGSKAATLTATQVADLAVQLVTAADGDSVFFISGNDAYVFNNNSAGDTLVKLVGLGGTADTLVGLTGTNTTTTDGYLYIG